MDSTDRTRGTVGGDAPQPAQLVLSEEQLAVGTRWVRSGSVRLRRRVVSETRTVEVTVRRTELVVESDDVDFSADGGTVSVGVGTARSDDAPVDGSADGPGDAPAEGGTAPAAQDPLVIILAQEEPQVTTVVRPYERVTVRVDRVADSEQVNARLAAERVDLDVTGTDTSGLPSTR